MKNAPPSALGPAWTISSVPLMNTNGLQKQWHNAEKRAKSPTQESMCGTVEALLYREKV